MAKKVKVHNNFCVASSLWLKCSSVVRNAAGVCRLNHNRISILLFQRIATFNPPHAPTRPSILYSIMATQSIILILFVVANNGECCADFQDTDTGTMTVAEISLCRGVV